MPEINSIAKNCMYIHKNIHKYKINVENIVLVFFQTKQILFKNIACSEIFIFNITIIFVKS